MTVLLLALCACVLFFLQGLLGRWIGLAPDFSPVLVASAALFGRRAALVQAAVAVALLRSALDVQPMGLVVLVHLALALVLEPLRGIVFGERLITQWIVAFVAGAIYVALWIVAAVLAPHAARGGSGFVAPAVATLLAALFAPPVFALLGAGRARTA